MNPEPKQFSVARLLCDAAQTVGKFQPKFNPLFYWRK